MSSINVSSIWAAFNLSLVSATAFNVSASSNSCLLFITFNFLLACSSIWSANILAFSVSPRDFRWISAKCYMNWVKTYNFLMSIYISRNLLVTLFSNLDVSKKWLIALFCDLARDVLSIFSRNDLQKSNVFTGFLTSSETKTHYLSVMFLMLRTVNSILLHNRHLTIILDIVNED